MRYLSILRAWFTRYPILAFALAIAAAVYIGSGRALADAGDIANWVRVGRGTIVWRISGGSAYGHLIPGANATYNIGSAAKQVANITVSNLTVTGTSTASDDLVITDALNVTGTTTLNALVGNSTINSTGLMTADNLTVNGTVSVGTNATVTDALNVTGTTTLNALVGNTTLNTTGLATLDNATINGTLNTTIYTNGAAYVVNCTNDTYTATNVDFNTISNISGNHTVTLPTAASCAGRKFEWWDDCNKIGATGNFTVNVTSAGNVNGVDAITITNTSGASGNVTAFIARSNGTNWTCATIRR